MPYVLQGSVATRLRRGGNLNDGLTTDLSPGVAVSEVWKSAALGRVTGNSVAEPFLTDRDRWNDFLRLPVCVGIGDAIVAESTQDICQIVSANYSLVVTTAFGRDGQYFSLSTSFDDLWTEKMRTNVREIWRTGRLRSSEELIKCWKARVSAPAGHRWRHVSNYGLYACMATLNYGRPM